MCAPVKNGVLYELANALTDVVPGRVGEIFNLSETGGVYVPHRLHVAGKAAVLDAVMATVSGIAKRYKLEADAIEDHLDNMPLNGEAITELFVQLVYEMVCEEGMAPNVSAVRLSHNEAHFQMLKAVIQFFLGNYARDPRAFYHFLGDIYFAIETAVEESVRAGLTEAMEGGFWKTKGSLGEEEFKKIVKEETQAVLEKFFPRVGKIVFLNAVGRATESALKRADEIALEKIPPLPKIRH